MKETGWVNQIVLKTMTDRIKKKLPKLEILDGFKLPYANEIINYHQDSPQKRHEQAYQTDILVREKNENGTWTPRVVMECKLSRVTTHDAITYSQKAFSHKEIHPYLRYGILIGHRRHYPLPGRLFRHGAHFDFMFSWVDYEPAEEEIDLFINIILDEVKASQDLEEIIYTSRDPGRAHYTCLHKPLRLQKI